MFAPDNTSFQRLLSGVDLVIDAGTLGEYGLATDPVFAQAQPRCEQRTRAEARESRSRRPRRSALRLLARHERRQTPISTLDTEPYSFDFPPSPAAEPLVVGPTRLASEGQAPFEVHLGRRLARVA